MRRPISPEIDLKIVEGLAAGLSNKELASMYNVSTSYISKVKTGKKIPNIHILNPTLLKDENFEVYGTELTELIAYMDSKAVFVDKTEIIHYLESKMNKHLIRAKMYQEILRRYK